jgi:hypothetical protein
MDILSIITIIILGIIVLELTKHVLTKSILKFVVLIIVGLILFFTVISSLDNENVINSDNRYIQTGAAISDNLDEQPLIISFKEKFKSFLSDIQESISNKLDK